MAQRRQHADVGRPQQAARVQGDLTRGEVFAGQAPVVAGPHDPWRDRDLAVAGLAELLRHHGVEAGRHHGARHDSQALAGQHFTHPLVACEARADHVERGRRIDQQVAAAQRVAIHRRVVVCRHVDGRNDIAGQHAAERRADRHALDGLDPRHQARDELLRLRHRQCLGVVAPDAGSDVLKALHHGSIRGSRPSGLCRDSCRRA